VINGAIKRHSPRRDAQLLLLRQEAQLRKQGMHDKGVWGECGRRKSKKNREKSSLLWEKNFRRGASRARKKLLVLFLGKGILRKRAPSNHATDWASDLLARSKSKQSSKGRRDNSRVHGKEEEDTRQYENASRRT